MSHCVSKIFFKNIDNFYFSFAFLVNITTVWVNLQKTKRERKKSSPIGKKHPTTTTTTAICLNLLSCHSNAAKASLGEKKKLFLFPKSNEWAFSPFNLKSHKPPFFRMNKKVTRQNHPFLDLKCDVISPKISCLFYYCTSCV